MYGMCVQVDTYLHFDVVEVYACLNVNKFFELPEMDKNKDANFCGQIYVN